METKQLQVKMAEEDEGIVTARFATLGVKDLDGDVILPGAFGSQKVKVSAYGHTSWGGALPVGVGEIREEGDEALAELQFFLNTRHGRDHFETVKGLGELGEWSFGFDVTAEEAPSEEQRQAGVMRVLKGLKVHEVSPVLRGAGVGTATVDVKCDACAAKGGHEPTPPQAAPEPSPAPAPAAVARGVEDAEDLKSVDEIQDLVAQAEGRNELIQREMERW